MSISQSSGASGSVSRPAFQVGDSAKLTRTISEQDIQAFALVSGDTNPVHLDEAYAAGSLFGRRVAHGMLSASFISAVLGTTLPGPGAIYVKQSLEFLAPVFIGDTVTVTVTIISYDTGKGKMVLSTTCHNQKGEQVINGEAVGIYRP